MKLLSVLTTVIIFSVLFIEFFHPVSAITQDLGRHIKTGEIIIKTRSVPKINLFSYTYPNFPFINTHWFSEVLFYSLVNFFSVRGLLIFTTAMTLLAFAVIYFFSINEGSLFSIAIVSLLYLGILAERTDLRPEIFSFFFIALFVSILYSYRKKFTRFIFLLPLIELFWVNMHIYFIVGIIISGLFLIDELISKKRALTIKKSELNHFAIFFGVFLLTCLVTIINPNGFNGALFPFFVFRNYGYTIQENQNIFFLFNYGASKTIPYFVFSVLILFFCLVVNLKKTKVIDWLLCVTFTILGAMEIRNFVLFVFSTYIPFVYALTNTSKTIIAALDKLRNVYVFPGLFFILVLVAFWQAVSLTSTQGFGWNMPTGAKSGADFLIKNHLQGKIFNNFDIGSYLDYRIYPQKVFVDGRPEAYPASFFQNVYIPMQENKTVFQKVSSHYKFNTIFFAYTDQTPWAEQFIGQIINNNDWSIVYLDDMVVILLKNIPENQKMIQHFGMDKNNVTVTNLKTMDKKRLLNLANFFIETGWIEQEVKIDKDILALDENSCPVLTRLISIYSQTDTVQASIYRQKYLAFCR